jgi:glutathione peroxidase
MKRAVITGVLVCTDLDAWSDSMEKIYQFSANDIDGNPVSLSDYRGKLVMIVNVASKCGFTPQYEGLQALYEKYRDRDFVILGFPANNFMRQEPGSNEEIKEFCSLTYGVSFPMFEKISVKGGDIHPLYNFLTDKKAGHDFGGKITWNFNKFLIGRDGEIIARFPSKTEPLSEEVVSKVEEAL